MKLLSDLGVYLTDLFFPLRCVACARAGFAFCPHCAQAVEAVPDPICPHCGHPQRQPVALCSACQTGERDVFVLIRAATLFTGPMRPAIHGLKYEKQPELGGVLARYLIAVAQQPPWADILPEIDAIVPVPLHSERLAERGYNQSALLANAFGAGMGLPVAEGWLARTRITQSQTTLSAAERQKNVADAFHAGPEVAGKRLLLMDDVFTTGSTLTACAVAVRQAGAAAVYGLTLATPSSSAGNSLGDS